ncbi:succinate dehydrogenase [ubiquinone] cytochrome b small subunit, mitochondrial [Chironomus tepperi]|uniref:succinate dehydrogenase [ubiquinone] cytochrome b small subunit, mitochondrial n=1 Tax=Chironomus tepperi TaxID=113505 RepID=UPI00391F990C
MALSLLIRSSSRLPQVLINSSRITGASYTPILAKQITINNVRPISVSPIRQSATGSHVAMWQAEKALSLGLLGIIPASFLVSSQATDYLVSLALVVHFHWGMESIVTDYVRECLFGKFVPKAAHAALLLFSAATLAGLFMMAYNDQGLTKTVKKIWAIQPAK